MNTGWWTPISHQPSSPESYCSAPREQQDSWFSDLNQLHKVSLGSSPSGFSPQSVHSQWTLCFFSQVPKQPDCFLLTIRKSLLCFLTPVLRRPAFFLSAWQLEKKEEEDTLSVSTSELNLSWLFLIRKGKRLGFHLAVYISPLLRSPTVSLYFQWFSSLAGASQVSVLHAGSPLSGLGWQLRVRFLQECFPDSRL